MDIVRRAYLQVRKDLPPGATAVELHSRMVDLMTGWIQARGYSRRDWPSQEFGPYPETSKTRKSSGRE